MLPHLATHAARYDATSHRLHAYSQSGEALCFETPAELMQAIATQRIYAGHAVTMAGVLLALHHGVSPTHYAAEHAIPTTLRHTPPALLPQAVHQHLQRLDRALERTARLACELLTDDDVVTIIDTDGLLTTVIQRLLQRETDSPHVQLLPHHDWAPSHTATVVLWHASIGREGHIAAPIAQQLSDLHAQRILAYVLAPQGPDTEPMPADALLCPSAVITSRGIYRADRVSRYLQESDLGGDMIPLQ
jgi:hypothetical protein